MSQCKALMGYLKRNGSITQKDALIKLGIARLASRIYDLRNIGADIHVQPEIVQNRFGKPVKIARYFLVKSEEVAA